jgi:hypothetical protein
VLPPVGLAVTLPLSSNLCVHLIADEALTPNRSPAVRREPPSFT